MRVPDFRNQKFLKYKDVKEKFHCRLSREAHKSIPHVLEGEKGEGRKRVKKIKIYPS